MRVTKVSEQKQAALTVLDLEASRGTPTFVTSMEGKSWGAEVIFQEGPGMSSGRLKGAIC